MCNICVYIFCLQYLVQLMVTLKVPNVFIIDFVPSVRRKLGTSKLYFATKPTEEEIILIFVELKKIKTFDAFHEGLYI